MGGDPRRAVRPWNEGFAITFVARYLRAQQLARARIEQGVIGMQAAHAFDISPHIDRRKHGVLAIRTAQSPRMLTHLAIRDFAVVSAAALDFGPGMTVISGETGAGKSLLVDALNFLSGLRADSGMVRHGAERAELTAEFELHDAPDAAAWLRDQEFDDDGHCQLRRTLRADGGSRAPRHSAVVGVDGHLA